MPVLAVIGFECGKMRTRITPNTDTFYAVGVLAAASTEATTR